MVIGEPQPGWYLVQLFDWTSGGQGFGTRTSGNNPFPIPLHASVGVFAQVIRSTPPLRLVRTREDLSESPSVSALRSRALEEL